MAEFEAETEPLRTEEINPDANEKSDSDSWYQVDVGMISSKLSYFFQNGKDSCYLPYMMLFLTNIGLTHEQAGRVNGFRFIGFIFGAPLWGILADYKKIHRIIIFILCISAFVLMSSQPFISIPMSQNKVCENEIPHNKTGNHSTSRNTTHGSVNENNNDGNTKLFAVMMTINLIASCFDGSTQGFVDSGVMQKVNTRRVKTDFGKQRLFGAIGYGVGAFASSVAVEYFPKTYLPCYSSVFIIYGCFLLSLTLCTYLLYKDLSFDLPTTTSTRARSVTSDIFRGNNVGKNLLKTLSKLKTLFFFTTVLLVGAMNTVYISFLFVLLKELNCQNIVMGLSIVVGAIASATFIKLSEKFIQMCGGPIRVLACGTLSWALRFLLFYYMKNPWVVLPIQLLQGFGYGMFITTSLVHIRAICTPDIYTSMYGIFNGLFFGAGAILGNVVGGKLLMTYTVRELFLGTSILGFIWTFIMIIYMTITCRRKREEESLMSSSIINGSYESTIDPPNFH